MSDVLSRLKAGTLALLRGGQVAEIVVDTAAGESAAVTVALDAAAAAAPAAAPAAESKPDAGKGKKDKMGRMPGDEGYDENDPADDDEPEASAPDPAPAAEVDAAAAAHEAAQARYDAVLASPECAGRMDLARNLLSNRAMTADQIIAALKVAPKAGAASVQALLGHDNPDLGAGGDAGTSPKAEIEAMWDRAIATVNPTGRGSANK